MSESDTEEPQKNVSEEPEETKIVEEVGVSDDEDDSEGYFLEPVASTINIAEKIAEANKKLFEEKESDEGRERKVQFSDKIINFEPNDYSDEDFTESAKNSIISEEEIEVKLNDDEETIIPLMENVENSETAVPEEEEEEEEKEEEEGEREEELVEEEEEQVLEQEVGEERNLTEYIPTATETDYNEPKECEPEEEDTDEIVEELDTDVTSQEKELGDEQESQGCKKLLFVLLHKDQNSSCESIIGEEIIDKENLKTEDDMPSVCEKVGKTKITRPKSACSKLKKSCEMSKISPNLNYTSSMKRESWRGSRNPLVRSKSKTDENEKKVFSTEINVKISSKFLKKINIDDLDLENLKSGNFSLKRCSESRPKSSYNGWRGISSGKIRPKTAPIKRTCCVIKMDLPRYNGLRSEYGLSAEQLQERKQRTLEIKHKKQQNRLKERQEEIKKRNENEEAFQKWLFNKRKPTTNKKPMKIVDILARSDVYIQTHASYATSSVPYSVDYSISKKLNNKKRGATGKKSNKTINVAKYLEKVSPQFKRSFNIYLGFRPF